MRKSLVLFLVPLLVGMIWAEQGVIGLSPEVSQMTLTGSNDNGLELNVNLEEINFSEINTPAGLFTDLQVNGFTFTNDTGAPRLPRVRRIISVPLGAEVTVRARAGSENIIDLNLYNITTSLMPAQPPVSKSQTIEEIEFVYDENAYQNDYFTENELVSVEELGILRGLRLFVVNVEPVRYNPVSNELIVYNDIDISVQFT